MSDLVNMDNWTLVQIALFGGVSIFAFLVAIDWCREIAYRRYRQWSVRRYARRLEAADALVGHRLVSRRPHQAVSRVEGVRAGVDARGHGGTAEDRQSPRGLDQQADYGKGTTLVFPAKKRVVDPWGVNEDRT